MIVTFTDVSSQVCSRPCLTSLFIFPILHSRHFPAIVLDILCQTGPIISLPNALGHAAVCPMARFWCVMVLVEYTLSELPWYYRDMYLLLFMLLLLLVTL